MNRVGLAAALAALVVLGAPPLHAGAARSPAPHHVAWQELVHQGPSAGVKAVATDGDVVAGAGYTSNETGSPRLTVIASRASSGAVLWTQKLDVTSIAQQVAIGGGVVAVAGFDLTHAQSTGWFVRAYDARTGKVLWTDRMAADVHNQGNALAVALSGGKVYAAGFTGSCEFYGAKGCAATLRAYDARSGAKAWERTVGLQTAFSTYSALTVADGRLVAAGGWGDPLGFYPSGLLVQSYDPADGLPEWTAPVTTGAAGFGAAFESATAVAVDHGIVAVGGKTGTLEGATKFVVRTFDATTGAPGWSDVAPGGARSDTVNGLAFTTGRLVAAGMTAQPGGDEAYTVRAYDVKTGKLAWSDRLQSKAVNPGHQLEEAYAVVARGDRAYVVGRAGRTCETDDPGNCDVVVRAYDEAGKQVWADNYDQSGRDDIGQAAALSADRLVVGGSATGSYPNGLESKWLVRAYRI